MKVEDILVKEILDARGEPTIKVDIQCEKERIGSAQIPSGKSRGKNEAVVFSTAQANEVLERLVKPNIADRNFESVGEVDSFLVSLDGSPRKEFVGGNLMLGISLAFARAMAVASSTRPPRAINGPRAASVAQSGPASALPMC